MHVVLLLFCLGLSYLLCGGENELVLSPEDRVAIVTSVKTYFRTDCVFYLQSSQHNTDLSHWKRIVTKQKMSSLKELVTATLFLKHNQMEILCRKNKPLLVIITSDSAETRMMLQKLDVEKMSQYKWLLLSDAEDFLDDLFAGVDIPFDCELLVARRDGKVVLLTEVYRISPTHPLHKAHFGNWTPLQGLMSQSASLYRRRNSLRGLQLKTSTINGTLIKITKSINNKPVKVGGHFGDVWHLLENTLQFLSDFYTPQNLWYGADQGNGSWTGVVGQVLNREVEVTNADLIVNKPRSEVVAFISPIELDRQILVIKLPDTKDLVWDSFLKPLNPELYAVVLLCIVIFSISLSYSKKLLQKVKPRYIVASMVDVNAFSFPHALLSTFGVFCSQGHDEAPNFLSTRLILLAAYVTAVVIVTSYSACLLSFIMTKVYGLPFNNFEEFLKDGTYQLEVLAQSSTLMYFKTSQNMLMKTIYRKMIAPHESTLPKSITEGLHRVCARRKVATVNFESFLSSNIRKLNCTLQRVPHAFMAASKSMATRKNSPYRGILKVTLNNMVRSGIIQVIHERNFPDKFTVSEEEFVSVSLIDVIPIISVLAVGIVAAIMLLLVERLIAKNYVVKNKEMTLKTRMQDAIWLLHLEEQASLEEALRGVHIPLDCLFFVAQDRGEEVVLTDVYSLSSKLAVSHFGTWSLGGGLRIASFSFYSRISDLQGSVVTATTVHGPPMTAINKDTQQISGFLGEVWKELEYRMNFTTRLVLPADNSYGSLSANGSWSGMVPLLMEGQAQIAIGDFTINEPRRRVLDFTLPVYESSICVFIRGTQIRDIEWDNFLFPFSAELWISEMIAMVGLAFCLTVVRIVKLQEGKDRIAAAMISVNHVCAIFCQQGIWGLPTALSYRILCLTMNILSITLFAAYSATLFSSLAVQSYVLPFNNFQELLKRRDYKLTVVHNSAILNEFEVSEDPVLHQVYEKFLVPMRQNLPRFSIQGLQKICEIDNYAFVTSYFFVAFIKNRLSCEVSPVPKASFKEYLSLATAKKSQYLHVINYNLLKLREDGSMKRLHDQTWSISSDDSPTYWHSVDILDATFVFVTVVTGMLIAIILLVLEIKCHKTRMCKN